MNPGGDTFLSSPPLPSTPADAGAAEEGEGEEGGAPMEAAVAGGVDVADGADVAGGTDVTGSAVDVYHGPCCRQRCQRCPGRIVRPQYCREVGFDFCWKSGGEY
jgi:hypothetical protein